MLWLFSTGLCAIIYPVGITTGRFPTFCSYSHHIWQCLPKINICLLTAYEINFVSFYSTTAKLKEWVILFAVCVSFK